MEDQRIILADNDQTVSEAFDQDFASSGDILTYDVIIRQGGKDTRLYIDIDPGGGFEGGYEVTQLTAKLSVETPFRFALHHEDFIDEVGKFFGMQDIQLGDPELDQRVVIKANDEEKIKQLLADENVRQVLIRLEDFDFGIHKHLFGNDHHPALEFNINEGVTDPADLKLIYQAFYTVLTKIDQ